MTKLWLCDRSFRAPQQGVRMHSESWRHMIVRKNTHDPARLDRGREEVARFDELHAQQPGVCGTIASTLGTNESARLHSGGAAMLPLRGPPYDPPTQVVVASRNGK
jgi:hypothetical protein